MKIYRTELGAFVEQGGSYYSLNGVAWDNIIAREDVSVYLADQMRSQTPRASLPTSLAAPIGSQEVWAAGVTYYRSRDARMQESKDAGGGSFYDRVYAAERPELFFKATPHRVVGPGAKVAIRTDAKWSVPEPELALFISPKGKIVGYTVGNDMSSRDIEGENPLYLPQAKVYDRSCALGPALLVTDEPLPAATPIEMTISRNGTSVFSGATSLKELKRDPRQLVEYLYRQCSFPAGCFLLTGTGIVPPDSFTLQPGDEIRITIPPVGTLMNIVG